MPYVSTIQHDWHAEAFRRGNAYQVLVNVGYDDALQQTYSISVGLEPQPGGGMEYYFCFIVADEIKRTEQVCWCGLDSQDILPKEQRGAVLRAILHATRLLISQVNPAIVNWCTWDANPPDKALRKHILIARVFELLGYEIGHPDAYHGKHIWWAERLNPPGFPFDERTEE